MQDPAYIDHCVGSLNTGSGNIGLRETTALVKQDFWEYRALETQISGYTRLLECMSFGTYGSGDVGLWKCRILEIQDPHIRWLWIYGSLEIQSSVNMKPGNRELWENGAFVKKQGRGNRKQGIGILGIQDSRNLGMHGSWTLEIWVSGKLGPQQYRILGIQEYMILELQDLGSAGPWENWTLGYRALEMQDSEDVRPWEYSTQGVLGI